MVRGGRGGDPACDAIVGVLFLLMRTRFLFQGRTIWHLKMPLKSEVEGKAKERERNRSRRLVWKEMKMMSTSLSFSTNMSAFVVHVHLCKLFRTFAVTDNREGRFV